MEKFHGLAEKARRSFTTRPLKERREAVFMVTFTDMASRMAIRKANIIALGYIVSVTGMIKPESLGR